MTTVRNSRDFVKTWFGKNHPTVIQVAGLGTFVSAWFVLSLFTGLLSLSAVFLLLGWVYR